MSQQILLDTGPLVAYLKQQDRFHAWVSAQVEVILESIGKTKTS